MLPSEVLDAEGRRYSIGVAVPDDPNEPKSGPRLRSGKLLTVDMIVRTAVEKAALRERYSADVVDMETSAVAGICSERGVRFLSIRVISDVAGEDLPKEVVALMSKSGSYLVGSAFARSGTAPPHSRIFGRCTSTLNPPPNARRCHPRGDRPLAGLTSPFAERTQRPRGSWS